MANAVVGDDVFVDDPTVLKLQAKVAELLNKEDALFVSSGVMANLVSMMLLCPQHGSSVILGNMSHILTYERGGIGSVAGV